MFYEINVKLKNPRGANHFKGGKAPLPPEINPA